MTDTLISLISIFAGILGANLLSVRSKKHNLGFTGNTIAGVFGSIFFMKVFGKLGFDPRSIMALGEINGYLFTLNILTSLLGGFIGLIGIKFLKTKITNAN